jgi:hypothetical protein
MFDYSDDKRLHFTVIDLDKDKEYPLNFICLLPIKPTLNQNKADKFSKLFGNNRTKIAKQLLIDALRKEDDDKVKHEIVRRLHLLEPAPTCEKNCISCGKVFQVKAGRKSIQKFCKNCLKNKFENT